ncbi:MAG: MCP four helix bundle domain-containing protein, partial [Candidatus Sericytochromatia bacterium]
MRLRLKTRLSMGLAAMGVAMAVVVILLALTFNTASRNIAQVHANHLPSLELTNRLLIRIERMENQEFLFIAPGEDREAHIRQFDLEARAFERLYQELQPLTDQEGEQEKYAEIGRHYGAYLHVNGRMRDLLAAGSREEARRVNMAESVPLSRRMREAAEVLHSHNWRESQRAKDAAVTALQRSIALAAALLLVGGLVAVALYQRTVRTISGPLQDLGQAAAALERGEHPHVDSPWAQETVELAELQAAFNRTSDALQRLSDDLKAANSNLEAQVASRTQQLRAANEQLAALVEELKTVDKLKSDFMAVVSHELLTPINFVSGYGSALEDGVMGE